MNERIGCVHVAVSEWNVTVSNVMIQCPVASAPGGLAYPTLLTFPEVPLVLKPLTMFPIGNEIINRSTV